MIKLKTHQEKVVNYMKKTGQRGIILYHSLGSGKTITAIAISKLYDKKVIVIVPASLRTQWDSELKKMKVDMQKYTVVSYEGFIKLLNTNKMSSLKDKCIILDEAHRIRNSSGKITKQISELLQTAFKVILLTGTPIVNSPVDISVLINCVSDENIMPVDTVPFKEKFYKPKVDKLPDSKIRCKLYSQATCSNNGTKVNNGLCKYHYYLYKRKLSAKNRNKEYEQKQKKRIDEARTRLRHITLEINKQEFINHIKNKVSYYKPETNIKDFPDVKKKSN